MNLKIDFEDKKREFEVYFQLLQYLDSARSNTQILSDDKTELFTVSPDLYRVMKANCYLMLYNLIEGTVVEGLNTIFVEISSESPLRTDLIELYQKICIDYRLNVIKILQAQDMFNPFLSYTQNDAINDINIFEIKDFREKKTGNTLSGYDAYIEVIGSKDISGNIDAKKIRELFPKYGIDTIQENTLIVYTNEDGREIKLRTDYIRDVKTCRNQLAHGRLRYTEVGRQKSFPELNEIKKHVFKYLDEIVDKIESFILSKGYKK